MPIPQITAIARVTKALEEGKLLPPMMVCPNSGSRTPLAITPDLATQIAAWCLNYLITKGDQNDQ